MSSSHSQTVRHHAYLDALGVACYVSTQDLPGAAPSQREQWRVGEEPAVTAPVRPVPEPAPEVPRVMPEQATPQAVKQPRQPEQEAPKPSAAPAPVARLTLCAVVAGPYLWLEELPGAVLGREQVQLMSAMAQALGTATAPRVSQFDWPPHNNRQLDLGADAARAALHSFLERQVEQQGCQALVVLGEAARRHLGDAPVGGARCIHAPASTAQMLADPARKRAVWEAIRPLRTPPQGKDAL